MTINISPVTIEMAKGILRHILTTIGGSFIANGILTADDVNTLIGAVISIVGIALSAYSKKASKAVPLILLAILLWPSPAVAQQTTYDLDVRYVRLTLTPTTATADTGTFNTAGTQQMQIQWVMGTVVGTYTDCNIQAKTSNDNGANFLTIGAATGITVTTGTVNTWTITAPGAATVSSTVANSFGPLSKLTFTCVTAYGTSAPSVVTVTSVPTTGVSSTISGTVTVTDSGIGATTDAASAVGGVGSLNAKERLASTQRDAIQTAVQTIDNIVNGTSARISGTSGAAIEPTADPCDGARKSQFVVNIATATTTEIANAVSGEFFWICSINLITAAANNVAIVEDDTDGVGSPTAGLNGGVTAATGWNFVAGGGIALGNGNGTVMKTGTANRYLGIMTSAATQLSGTILYVSAP